MAFLKYKSEESACVPSVTYFYDRKTEDLVSISVVDGG